MSNILRIGLIITGIFVGLAFLLVGISLLVLASAVSGPSTSDEDAVSGSGEKVAIVEVQDVITSSENIVRQLKKYSKNSGVKAIVVRVETPGGGVAASQEIYEEIKNISKSGKPVIISMGNVAASGGYYISLGANRIVANPSTLTGSISAVLQYPNISGLLNKMGVNMVTFKSGRLKDAGSPYRSPTPEDQQYFQDLITDTYDQFVEAVAEGRHMSPQEVKKYADGRAFTGRQAYEYKLIDTLGTYEDAIRIAAKMAGIQGEPRIVKEKKKVSFFDKLSVKLFDNPFNKFEELLDEPILEYKFTK